MRDIGDATFEQDVLQDRKSTRLNSSHLVISYDVFCLKKKLAVGAERHVQNGAGAPLECPQLLAPGRVPHLILLLAARGRESLVPVFFFESPADRAERPSPDHAPFPL